MGGQPLVVFLVRAVVVEDDVNLLIVWNINDQLVHERLKVRALLGVSRLRFDFARSDIECGKQVDRAMSLVSALQSPHDFAAAGEYVWSAMLQVLLLRRESRSRGLLKRDFLPSEVQQPFRLYGHSTQTPSMDFLQHRLQGIARGTRRNPQIRHRGR
jgi:hypothetical protein